MEEIQSSKTAFGGRSFKSQTTNQKPFFFLFLFANPNTKNEISSWS